MVSTPEQFSNANLNNAVNQFTQATGKTSGRARNISLGRGSEHYVATLPPPKKCRFPCIGFFGAFLALPHSLCNLKLIATDCVNER